MLATCIVAVLLSGHPAAGASDADEHGEEFAPDDRAEEPDVPPDPSTAFAL